MARVSRKQIEDEIIAQIRRDPGRRIHRRTRDFAEEVQNRVMLEWAESGPHPYETGRFIQSIKIRETQGREGFSKFEVYSDDPHAVFIEYGTGPDKPGGHSPWGPNTPTPEFAPFAKTALHYGAAPT